MKQLYPNFTLGKATRDAYGETLRELAAEHAALALAAGVFPPGSMGPKIEAALDARHAGARSIIAHLDHALDAVEGRSGTEIT